MKIIQKECVFPCSAEKLWSVLLDKDSYNDWTKAFSTSSTYSGVMALGEEIEFLDENGFGLKAKITTFIPAQQIVFTFIGELADGKVKPQSEDVDAAERYLLTEDANGTTLSVQADVEDEYYDEMNSMWDVALENLMVLCQRSGRK